MSAYPHPLEIEGAARFANIITSSDPELEDFANLLKLRQLGRRVRRAEQERRGMIDFDEARKRIEQAETERDEAGARADVAGYVKDALALRCQELEAEIALLGGAA